MTAPAGKGRSSGRATLAQVAARAKVGVMTASRALSQPHAVSESLRARVAQAAAELAYVPNRAARALASARSNVIVALVPSLTNAVFADVLTGIEDALAADAFQVLIGNTHYSDAQEERLLGVYLQSNPDGILLSGLNHSARVRQMLADAHVPVVSMMDLASAPEQWSVGFSQLDAGRAMTRYLIERGYARIGFMGAQRDERTLRRAEGYRQVLSEAGRYDPARELMVDDPSTIALGARLLDQMMSAPEPCDAIFCCNDDLAHGAIFQCQRRGWAVPERVAICGFNDLPASAWMQPAVTTISTPRYRIGVEAATLLRELIQGKQPAAHRIDLGFTLMARASA